MLEKLTAASLLTMGNIKTIIETERLVQTKTDTLIIQFASSLRIRKQAKVVSVIHDYREAEGWDLAKKFGPIRELIVVGRIGTHTADVNLHAFPFFKFDYVPLSLMLTGWNTERSCFAFAQQECCWDEGGQQSWGAPCFSVATTPSRRGFFSPLEDIYAGVNAYVTSNMQDKSK